MTSKPEQPVDDRLLHAHDLALSALHEITPADTVGPPADYIVENDGVVSLRFHTRLLGYPGWYWTVSVAVVDDAEPTVLEAELMPGEGALLAPEWVPWATRLADYQAAQAAAAESGESDDDVDDDDVDVDDDDLDGEDDDAEDDDESEDEPKARFHAGDLDGVDIDEFDESGDAEPESEDDSDGDEEDGDEEDDYEEDDDEDDEDERERSY
ncbi:MULTISPECIES: DUF3027 domain-containing protein [Microbacterium]|uniref:DUF3027 domain-containing protein n=1 Tax=Microbacterium TaxID=33882 RepID=UPI00277FB3A4|nr:MULTISPECIES: DUF3027 domain-containing protein [Microbacterium]MDQ1076281.1 hypothetical protein [Microbacterium sp. SORGH_AS_0969]MDQ1116518.1 hypothetical protein [Microbacterium testaceum]